MKMDRVDVDYEIHKAN